MKKIKIFDTTLRDGEQSPSCSMTIEEKVKVAKQLEKLNVDIIEAGFAASSKKDKDAIEEISKNIDKPIIAVLARLNKKDIDEAYESLQYAKNKRIHVFIATSDIHMKEKLHKTKDEILDSIRTYVGYAKSKCEDIEFSLEDATRTDLDFMCKVIATAISAGATTINIPDTVGYITPNEYKNIIEYIKLTVPNIDNITLSSHCHNDLGLATANTLAGIKSGIEQVECCVNGIGERAGNASLEQIVMSLEVRKDYYKAETNIDKKEIINTSSIVAEIVNEHLERTRPIVGENVSIHSSGIHQDGVIKNKSTYEIIDFSNLGKQEDNIKIDIHSGKTAIIYKLNQYNIDIPSENIREFVTIVKDYLNEKKEISDEELIDLAKDYQTKIKQKK